MKLLLHQLWFCTSIKASIRHTHSCLNWPCRKQQLSISFSHRNLHESYHVPSWTQLKYRPYQPWSWKWTFQHFPSIRPSWCASCHTPLWWIDNFLARTSFWLFRCLLFLYTCNKWNISWEVRPHIPYQFQSRKFCTFVLFLPATSSWQLAILYFSWQVTYLLL